MRSGWPRPLTRFPSRRLGWQKFTLPAPVTFDLATMTAAGLVQAATGEKLPAGTYRQLHLVLEDSADALSAAAQALGLTYNAELSFTDASGTAGHGAAGISGA